jgi:hypothetical protein
MTRYVLERDRRPPHEGVPLKKCARCKVPKGNNFTLFPKVRWGTQRFGPRHTTGDVCRECVSKAMSTSAIARGAKSRESARLMAEDAASGAYLALKCNRCCERAVGTDKLVCDECAATNFIPGDEP